MPMFVVFGTAVFANERRRDRISGRAATLAANNGFTPSSRIDSIPPGVTPYLHTAQEDGDGLTAGNTYPAVTFCFEHHDQQAVADAELLIQDEIGSQGWLWGSVGTWTDISG